MFLKWFFKRLSKTRQAELMKRWGIVLGTRNKDGRSTYLYMMNNLFAEILYENDNPRMEVESVVVLDGLDGFKSYLEDDIRLRPPRSTILKNLWL
ncbi:MAG TPA: hypothetical protein VFO54_09970 [Chryseosolibacter sp.]|nr:hypothetical protein [Chryseosolibacter sp.]